MVLTLRESLRESRERQWQWAVAELEKQIAAIKAGRQDWVYLYCSADTDDLLRRLEGVSGVKGLVLELTDVSDEGMESVAGLQGLNRLLIYGGNPGVSDCGFVRLRTLCNLEGLRLVNTHVTDEGLAILKGFPKLRTLTLFHEARRGPTLTDAGLVHLKTLTNLQTLGGWVSDNAVRDLRKSIPTCKIKTQSRVIDCR